MIFTYNIFNNNLKEKKQILEKIHNKIQNISEYSLYNIGKITEIGKVLKYFYELHTDSLYDDAIMYSIGFNGYIDCFEGLQKNIKERKISFAKFPSVTGFVLVAIEFKKDFISSSMSGALPSIHLYSLSASTFIVFFFTV